MIEKVHRIQDAGLEVWCGMILGFDNDDDDDLRRAVAFLEEARIASAMVGMLTAIPKTPLYDRLLPRDGSTRTTSPGSAPTSSRCRSAARNCATVMCG